MKGHNLIVATTVNGRLSNLQSQAVPEMAVGPALATMLCDLDRLVLATLGDSHLAIDRLTVEFQFGRLFKRQDVAQGWIEAVRNLAEIIDILPEHLGVAAASSPSQAKPQ